MEVGKFSVLLTLIACVLIAYINTQYGLHLTQYIVLGKLHESSFDQHYFEYVTTLVANTTVNSTEKQANNVRGKGSTNGETVIAPVTAVQETAVNNEFVEDVTRREESKSLEYITIPVGNETRTVHCPQQHVGRPPLAELIGYNHTITGDVSWLLDYAIVAFGKCGTTTLMNWFNTHPNIQSIPHEIYDLMTSQPDKLAKRMYCQLQAGDDYLRGYKSPNDISQPHILEQFEQYYSKTKLFVGVRHPVSWFQSLYNFRIQNTRAPDDFPPADKLLGLCGGLAKGTCTEKGNFMSRLIMLKKHESLELTEEQLQWQDDALSHYRPFKSKWTHNPMTNPVFIYEISQLSDSDEDRTAKFMTTVQDYLGLEAPMPPIPHHIPGKDLSDEEQARRNKYKINICDAKYDELRKDLMQLSRLNSLWIRQVFLEAPGVYYANKEHLIELFEKWMVDPCDKNDDEENDADETSK